MAFGVLVVCTGNVCRSPLAEHLLRARLAERLGDDAKLVEVRSAGTGALLGEPMTASTQRLLAGFGAVGCSHRARQVVEPLVASADLVLAMTRQHRSIVVRLHPPAVRKAFTLREVARLAPLVDVGGLPDARLDARLRAVVPALAARRGLLPVPDPAEDDVLDPYQQPDEVYEAMASQVEPAVNALVQLLVEVGDTPGDRGGAS